MNAQEMLWELEVIERAVYNDQVVPPHCGHRAAVKAALKKLRAGLEAKVLAR